MNSTEQFTTDWNEIPNSPQLTDEIRQILDEHPNIMDLWKMTSFGFKDDLKIYTKIFLQADVENYPETFFITFIHALCNYCEREEIAIENITIKTLQESDLHSIASAIENGLLEPVYIGYQLTNEV